MRKISILLPLLTFVLGSVYGAGPVHVNGRVIDGEGNPVAYATIVVKERNIGSVADGDGHFSLTLPDTETYTVAASCTGFTASAVSVSGPGPHRVELRLKEDLMNLNTIVVTGTRTPKLLKDVPVLTRVITSKDILKTDATDIGDLLQAELPAIEFSYSMNQQVSLNMQGFGGTSVLFLVDGERLAGETLDNVDYSRLGLLSVDRVEIVKGAASSLYGSNAVGGVVNIITADAWKPWSVYLSSRYGSHNAWRNAASVSFNQGIVNSVTDFQQTSQDNYSLGDRGDYTTLYGNATRSLNQRLGVKLSRKIRLVGKGGYHFRERDYSESTKNRYRGFTGGLKMNYDIGAADHLEVSYLFDQYDKSNYYTAKDKDIRNYSNIQNTARALYNHTFGAGNILTVGGDAMADYLMSYQFADHSHRQVSADVFAQFDWQVTEKVGLIGGLRYDYFSEKDRAQLSPKLAVMYREKGFAVRGSYGAGFRAPTLKEMYMNFDMGGIFMIYGNEDLKSETSHNFMLSAEYAQPRYNVTFSTYYNSVKNRITTVWNEELFGMQYVNTRKVDIFGTEGNFAVHFPFGLGARFSYAYTHEFVAAGEKLTSDTRPLSAVLRLEYGRNWKNYGFSVMLSGRYMSPVNTHTLTSSYSEYAEVRYPGYSMWKLIVSQNIWRAFTLTATVDNLLNYKPDYFFYNSPTAYGTMFSVGLSMRIEEIFKKR